MLISPLNSFRRAYNSLRGPSGRSIVPANLSLLFSPGRESSTGRESEGDVLASKRLRGRPALLQELVKESKVLWRLRTAGENLRDCYITRRPDQQHKRHRKENSAEKAASSSYQEANTKKRQKHNGEGGPKSAEFYKALEEELNAKSFDPVTTDKSGIEEELQSGSSILVLESTPSRRSHCRALLCIRHKLTGIINIESDYRFNLKDLTGKRSGDLSHYLRKSHSSGLSE